VITENSVRSVGAVSPNARELVWTSLCIATRSCLDDARADDDPTWPRAPRAADASAR